MVYRDPKDPFQSAVTDQKQVVTPDAGSLRLRLGDQVCRAELLKNLRLRTRGLVPRVRPTTTYRFLVYTATTCLWLPSGTSAKAAPSTTPVSTPMPWLFSSRHSTPPAASTSTD